MARRARHYSTGAIYHVMLRGNNGQSIFSSDIDRCRFCFLMQEGVERYGHRILAFCFMSNHVHLAIKLSNISLSKICQNLAFRYTRFYNQGNKTIGHLFQGRFKSILVDGNRYLKELIRYIHLNPVRAKMVDDPLNYQWSSHRAYLMKQEFTWLEKDMGLQIFGESRSQAMEMFHHYVLSGIGLDDGIDFKKGVSEGVLGDDKFVERTLEEARNNRSYEPLTIDFKTLITVIMKKYRVDAEKLKGPSLDRQMSHIRSMAALLARDTVVVSLRELADFFGRADNSMSQSAARLQVRMNVSDIIKNEVDNLKGELLLAME